VNLADAVGQRLLVSFQGSSAPSDLIERIRHSALGGVSLYRSLNVVDPEQVRSLTSQLQSAAHAAGQTPLLIAADQEGGQLIGLGEATTSFPGNMALGATGSSDLAHEVGYALGRECAAMGVNVNFAPVCDVNSNPPQPGRWRAIVRRGP
jgi:beta-N-acetylhexosaminidase